MKFHYVWLFWSSAFLLPWLLLFASNPRFRAVMWRTSCWTALLGITEPIYVPEYWNPPSLFELAQRTGFDIESFIFSFAMGGVGAVLYNFFTRQDLVPINAVERLHPRHKFHRAALYAPYVLFVPLYFLPWNVIYPSILCLVIGAVAAVLCRPDLKYKTFVGGFLFLGFYAIYMLGLTWFAPGYIEQVWNLPELSGVLVYGIPLEELLFGFGFGLYWTGVYEHFTWNRGASQMGGAAHGGHEVI
jgi:hypothetical protein